VLLFFTSNHESCEWEPWHNGKFVALTCDHEVMSSSPRTSNPAQVGATCIPFLPAIMWSLEFCDIMLFNLSSNF
jgi:hypothetical protein